MIKWSAADAGTTNCVVCPSGRPELLIVGFPTTGKPQSQNVNDPSDSLSYDKRKPEDLKLSPLDCLLLFTHTPRQLTDTWFSQFWSFDKTTPKHGCQSLKPRDQPAIQLPQLTPKIHEHISMVCLKRLIINGSHTPEHNYTEFSNDPGANCSETWLIITYDESIPFQTDTALHGPKDSNGDTNFERFHNCDNDSAWGDEIKAYVAVRLHKPSASGLLWLCNSTLYRTLPTNWTGVCGLVTLAQEVHIQTTCVKSAQPTPQTQTKHILTQ